MKDSFGRTINYLRLSLTDRCNLRCVYCMPLHDLTFVPNEDLLTANELEQVVKDNDMVYPDGIVTFNMLSVLESFAEMDLHQLEPMVFLGNKKN